MQIMALFVHAGYSQAPKHTDSHSITGVYFPVLFISPLAQVFGSDSYLPAAVNSSLCDGLFAGTRWSCAPRLCVCMMKLCYLFDLFFLYICNLSVKHFTHSSPPSSDLKGGCKKVWSFSFHSEHRLGFMSLQRSGFYFTSVKIIETFHPSIQSHQNMTKDALLIPHREKSACYSSSRHTRYIWKCSKHGVSTPSGLWSTEVTSFSHVSVCKSIISIVQVCVQNWWRSAS